MNLTKLIQLSLAMGFALIYLRFTSAAERLECYVCENCDGELNSSYVQPCPYSSTKCIKLVLTNEEVDRGCGDKKRCGVLEKSEKPSSRTRRFISENFYALRHRIRRSLLGDTPVNKGNDGPREVSSVHCCGEKACNGASPQAWFYGWLLLFFPTLLFLR